MRIFFLGAIIALLSACGSQTSYYKPNITQQQGAADQSQCNAQANYSSTGTDGWTGLAIFAQNKNMCMVGKGYTVMCGEKPCNPQY